MNEQEIIRLCSEYKRNKRQMEELNKQNERIKTLLLDELDSRGGETFTAGEYKVQESKAKRETLDAAKLKAELPTVYYGFVRVSEVKRFLIH